MLNKIYFHHIPKTAGTTVTQFLQSQPNQKHAPAHLWSELLALPRERLAEYNLFTGHFYRPLHRFLGEDLAIIVFVRNPIDRALSHFEHVRREASHYFHDRVARHNSFLEFILDPVTRPLVENFQVRALAAQFDLEAIAGDAVRGHRFWLERAIEATPIRVGEDELRIAKDYLERAACVGLTEETRSALVRIADIFGWPTPGVLEKLNVTSDRSTTALQLTDKELEAVSAATRLDALLYEAARRLARTSRN